MSESPSNMDTFFKGITGPFGALVISFFALFWLSQKFELFITQTIESHREDRDIFRDSIEKMTAQLLENNNKIQKLSIDVKDLSEDVKTLKQE